MKEIDVEFDRDASQVFGIGAASCAVPGTVAGLEAAHRAYGTLPWKRLLEPAITLAGDGVELTRTQGYLHAILDLILRHSPEGRAVYGPNGSRLVAGERVVMNDLAATLELLGSEGAKALYRGELGRALVRHVREGGGEITQADLESYRVVTRRPVRVPFCGREFVSNPPPSSGGVLIGYGLRLLDRLRERGGPGSAEAIAALVEVMREQTRARGGRFTSNLYRGGLAQRLYSEENVRAALDRIRRREGARHEPVGAPGTTHISVVDGHGNAASLTASTGSGSGVIVRGVHLNNMLGEYHLNPARGGASPGRRLTSMMAPSIVLEDDRPRLVVGSAGSVRLRGAILQIVVNVVEHGLAVEQAIGAPRVHLEEPHVHCEGGAGADPAELDRLEARGYELVRWRRRNLYFGGAAGVELMSDGTLAAAGDPRRGGHGVVVD
jgi:gamma-glutamyltranspeptidase/glutathione hydrolase